MTPFAIQTHSLVKTYIGPAPSYAYAVIPVMIASRTTKARPVFHRAQRNTMRNTPCSCIRFFCFSASA